MGMSMSNRTSSDSGKYRKWKPTRMKCVSTSNGGTGVGYQQVIGWWDFTDKTSMATSITQESDGSITYGPYPSTIGADVVASMNKAYWPRWATSSQINNKTFELGSSMVELKEAGNAKAQGKHLWHGTNAAKAPHLGKQTRHDKEVNYLHFTASANTVFYCKMTENAGDDAPVNGMIDDNVLSTRSIDGERDLTIIIGGHMDGSTTSPDKDMWSAKDDSDGNQGIFFDATNDRVKAIVQTTEVDFVSASANNSKIHAYALQMGEDAPGSYSQFYYFTRCEPEVSQGGLDVTTSCAGGGASDRYGNALGATTGETVATGESGYETALTLGNDSNGIDMIVYEVLIFAGPLTARDRGALARYIQRKYKSQMDGPTNSVSYNTH